MEPGPSPDRSVRLAPLSDEELSPRQREVLEPLLVGPTRNIYTTLVRAPDLAEAMTTLGRNLRGDGIPLRHRETLILRTGWNCRSNYEFAQHRRLANHGGMTDADVQRIIDGPDAPGWDPIERTLCTLADELHERQQVSDDTWNALAADYDDAQLIQAVLLVGYYHLVSFSLNAFGTPLEPGAVGFEG
ncbi:MAG TPA: carboxymuconolactone decarboxylase family protein [Acidimicrobiia bacterium]|nr:carboxymuconolactone decarboxylase family protein [Acidimicrobiia bacterium]